MSTVQASGQTIEPSAEEALRKALSANCADPDLAAEAVADLSRAGVRVANFSLGQPSLDEVFLALTGHPAEDQRADATAPAEEELPA